MKWINVILAIDERMDDVRACVKSLREVYGPGVPIALATYGGTSVGQQPAVAKYAAENGFPYIDLPRHDFLTDEDRAEWHACEVLVRMQITKHFADLGIEEVYIMHADVRIFGNFRPCFHPSGKWSFVAILLRAEERFSELVKKGSWSLYFESNPARLADILVRYNSAFVAQMYAKYGHSKGLWDKWISHYTLWGDLAQFDVARETEGFTGRYIQDLDDSGPICGGTVLHMARQAIPACLPEATRKGIDRAGMLKNYERRAR